jgi:hypothetical protein
VDSGVLLAPRTSPENNAAADTAAATRTTTFVRVRMRGLEPPRP